MIRPIFTEKSLAEAKNGKYSFWVDKGLTKLAIKTEISRVFGVHVTGVKTVSGKVENRRNLRGVRFLTRPTKKAIISVKDGEKIDIFEESKKK